MPYLPTLSGILSRDIKIRVPKVDIAGEDRVEQTVPENRVPCIKGGISLDAFYGAGEIGREAFRFSSARRTDDTSPTHPRTKIVGITLGSCTSSRSFKIHD